MSKAPSFFLEHPLVSGLAQEAIASLEEFCTILLFWQKKMNLISKKSETELWERHILDSLQLLPFITQTDQAILDLGSGAGFPGLILAIVFQAVPEKTFTLVDSNQKKIAFLKAVCRKLSLQNAFPHAVRISPEIIEKIGFFPDVITARALASLKTIVQDVHALAGAKTRLLLLKGKNVEQELKEIENNPFVSYVQHAGLLKESGSLLELRFLDLSPSVGTYPD